MVINMAGTQPIYQRVVIARSHIKPARLEHSSPRECCQINQNKVLEVCSACLACQADIIQTSNYFNSGGSKDPAGQLCIVCRI